MYQHDSEESEDEQELEENDNDEEYDNNVFFELTLSIFLKIRG